MTISRRIADIQRISGGCELIKPINELQSAKRMNEVLTLRGYKWSQ